MQENNNYEVHVVQLFTRCPHRLDLATCILSLIAFNSCLRSTAAVNPFEDIVIRGRDG